MLQEGGAFVSAVFLCESPRLSRSAAPGNLPPRQQANTETTAMPKLNNQKQANGSTLNFKAQLRAAADKMRGHMDASEYKWHPQKTPKYGLR